MIATAPPLKPSSPAVDDGAGAASPSSESSGWAAGASSPASSGSLSGSGSAGASASASAAGSASGSGSSYWATLAYGSRNERLVNTPWPGSLVQPS